MKRIAILGAGPAGLMAAQAAKIRGDMIVIFSQGVDGPTKSRLGGAQFLHKPIPQINDDKPDAEIRYLTAGTTEGYREKVYGSEDVPFVSMERLPAKLEVPAWRLQDTYDRLWGLHCNEDGSSVNVVNITAEFVMKLFESGNFDVIISTIPKMALCLAHAGLVDRKHVFVSQRIRIANESALPVENAMVYDGTRNVSWYRTSNIFGVGATEWGESAPAYLPYENIVTAKKPIRTDCNCFADQVLFAGRFGTWTKGVLTHDAFTTAWEALK